MATDFSFGVDLSIPTCVSSEDIIIRFEDQAEEMIVVSEPPPRVSRFLFNENDQIVNVGDLLRYQVIFKDYKGNPMKNSFVNIKIVPIQFPPSFYGLINPQLDLIYQMQNFITIDRYQAKTSTNGDIVLYVRILPNYFGKWGFCFFAGGVCSTPIFVKTRNPATTLKIIQEPSFPETKFPAGSRLPIQPKILVTGLNGVPIPGAVVLALIVPTTGSTATGLIDIFCSDINNFSSYDTYLTVTPEGERFQRTDSEGMAIFTNFGLIDVSSTACFSFIFVVGEPGILVQSNPTKQLCFYNNYGFKIVGKPSEEVGDNQPFVNIPVIEISQNISQIYPNLGPMIFSAYITDIDSKVVADQHAYSRSFLTGYICYYINQYILLLF